MTNPVLPPPTAFGLPGKFSQWRENQDLACLSMTEPEPRFLLQVCPTGFGKSATYITAATLMEGRTAILTSTKGLQSQLMKDFGSMDGVVEIRGRGNYPCRLNTKVNCDSGLCMFGIKCDFKEGGGCFYFDAVRSALRAKVVITNYSYWTAQNEFSEGLGKFDLLVLDEAHSSPDHVIDHTSVQFSKGFKLEREILDLDDSLPNDADTWAVWAEEKLTDAKVELEYAKTHRKEKKFIHLKRLVEKLTRLVDRINRKWVWEDNSFEVILTPTWPAPYCESVLFLGIPKVVLTSATVVPKTAHLLGIDSSHMKYEEYPHSFPLESRPLIHLPTVRMNFRNGPVEERLWISKLDNIIRDRIGTKGIIHTVSYKRRDFVMENSRYSQHMVTHQRKDTESVVRAFKRAKAPTILVSPSMATGWDFPDDECRWQVIVKLPFPDTRGEIMKARSNQDKDYLSYVVMQQLIQACGRGVRSETDWCETYLLDNNIQWFLKNNEHLCVEWFKGAYKVNPIIPKPLGGKCGN